MAPLPVGDDWPSYEGALTGLRACAGSVVERADGAVGILEAVSYIGCVDVLSVDNSESTDVLSLGALAGGCACAGNVEGGDGAILEALEAVIDVVSVDVVSRDRVTRIDAS